MTDSRTPKPVRRIHAYLVASTVVVRLPWWILTNLSPAQRPRRTWDLKKVVTRKVIRWSFAFDVELLMRIPTHEKLEKGFGGVWVEAAPEIITGKVKDWAEKAGIQPIRIPGYWIHKRGQSVAIEQKPDEKEKVVYFLHGGSYTFMSAHPKLTTSRAPKSIMKFCASIKRSFAIEYRLSSIPPAPTAGQFPSALLDAITGYNYLVNKVGFSPSQIVVLGDSAGGNLAQALIRYLAEYKDTIPDLPDVPGALILLSPWTDMTGSHHSSTSSAFTNLKTDFVFPPITPYTNDAPPAFIEPFGADFASQTPYISPASTYLPDVRFDNFPPTFVSAGDAEVLVDQIRELVKRLKANLGEDKAVYYEAKDAFHDYLCFDHTEPWKTDTLKAIARFLGERETGTTL